MSCAFVFQFPFGSQAFAQETVCKLFKPANGKQPKHSFEIFFSLYGEACGNIYGLDRDPTIAVLLYKDKPPRVRRIRYDYKVVYNQNLSYRGSKNSNLLKVDENYERISEAKLIANGSGRGRLYQIAVEVSGFHYILYLQQLSGFNYRASFTRRIILSDNKRIIGVKDIPTKVAQIHDVVARVARGQDQHLCSSDGYMTHYIKGTCALQWALRQHDVPAWIHRPTSINKTKKASNNLVRFYHNKSMDGGRYNHRDLVGAQYSPKLGKWIAACHPANTNFFQRCHYQRAAMQYRGRVKCRKIIEEKIRLYERNTTAWQKWQTIVFLSIWGATGWPVDFKPRFTC